VGPWIRAASTVRTRARRVACRRTGSTASHRLAARARHLDEAEALYPFTSSTRSLPHPNPLPLPHSFAPPLEPKLGARARAAAVRPPPTPRPTPLHSPLHRAPPPPTLVVYLASTAEIQLRRDVTVAPPSLRFNLSSSSFPPRPRRHRRRELPQVDALVPAHPPRPASRPRRAGTRRRARGGRKKKGGRSF